MEERGFGCYHTGDYSWSHLNSVGLMHFDSVEEEWFSAHKKVLCEGPRTVIEPAVSEVVCNVAKDLSQEGQLGSAEDTKPSINAESTLVGKSVDDVMICPKCGSDNCYEYSMDEIEFSYDNTWHYFVNCRCKDCDKRFMLYTRFKYELTDAHT